jgi:hypothetical protein
MKQVNILILAAGLAVAPETTTMGQETPPLDPEARRFRDSALELTKTAYSPPVEGETPAEQAGRVRDAARAFAGALDALAKELREPLAGRLSAAEGHDIEMKLAAIALDRRARPAIYAEIERDYVKATLPFPRPRATTTPWLLPAHATEPYRLAWEFMVLRPMAKGTSQVGERALSALKTIRNDASVPTLLHIYRLTCSEGIPLSQVATTQTHLLATMSAFRSQRGLRALLECASMSRRRKEMKEAGESAWDADRFVRDTLAGSFGNKEEWRKLASDLPREGLSHEDRRLLEQATGGP